MSCACKAIKSKYVVIITFICIFQRLHVIINNNVYSIKTIYVIGLRCSLAVASQSVLIQVVWFDMRSTGRYLSKLY